jgi:hypothetical protein
MNSNQFWDLMLFNLRGEKLSDYGAHMVVISNLQDSGRHVVKQTVHKKLSDRLQQPDWRDRFLAS